MPEISPCRVVGYDVATADSQGSFPAHIGDLNTVNKRFIMLDTKKQSVTCKTFIAAWELRFSGHCNLTMQVWIKKTSAIGEYTLYGQNAIVLDSTAEVIGRASVPQSDQILLTPSQTYYFGWTSSDATCMVDSPSQASSSLFWHYAMPANADLSKRLGQLVSFPLPTTGNFPSFRAILQGRCSEIYQHQPSLTLQWSKTFVSE